MGFSGEAWVFKDKKAFKAFKKSNLKLKEEDSVFHLNGLFYNLMYHYYGYSTGGKYVLQRHQLEELMQMTNDESLKTILTSLLKELDKADCKLLYVEGYY